MADVVAQSTQPALAAIKLAWWRERLEELDRGKVPAEPRLQAASVHLITSGIEGVDLATLEAGWATMLEQAPDRDVALNRGAILFKLAARILGSEPWHALGSAGRAYATASLLRRGFHLHPNKTSEPEEGVFLPPAPRRLRPVTGLTALALRDLKRGGMTIEPEATPGRAWTLLRHRLTGR